MTTPERLGGVARVSLVALLCGWTIASCSGAQKRADVVRYRGGLDVFLEPNDPQGVCSVTIGLRNESGARQGEAWLKLAWFDPAGTLLADQSLRMDPLDVGRYDAKNLALPVSCDRVDRMRVRSAEWTLFQGWDALERTIVRIDAVEGSEWRMRWDAQIGLFVGAPYSSTPSSSTSKDSAEPPGILARSRSPYASSGGQVMRALPPTRIIGSVGDQQAIAPVSRISSGAPRSRELSNTRPSRSVPV
jgi:hypothetical protein